MRSKAARWAAAIGRLIPADHIVVRTAGKLSGKYCVNVKMIDLRTGTIVGARNAMAEDLGRLSASLTEVAAQMTGVAPPPAAPAAPLAAPGGLGIREASFAFFESGPTVPPHGQRVFATVFDSRCTRFINWELTRRFPQTQAAVRIPVEVRFLRADGSLLTSQTMNAQVEAGWDWQASWNGWGAANTHNRAPGIHTVQAFAAGVPWPLAASPSAGPAA